MVALWGGAVSCERGTPVLANGRPLSRRTRWRAPLARLLLLLLYYSGT